MFRRPLHICLCPAAWHPVRTYSAKVPLKTFGQKKQHYGDLFPDKLLSKKQKTPAMMYLAREKTAHNINRLLDPYFKASSCDTIMEMNPGIGLMTRQLLERQDQFKKILLMETMDYFLENLQQMHNLYPERVKLRQGDLINAWKLAFQDKLDNGSRIANLFCDVPKTDYGKDPNMILFGILGCPQFFPHLINSFVFQNSFLTLGRTEMYFVLPPPIYLHLACTPEMGFMVYRATTILFQILFEYRFIARLPREDFLPTQADYNIKKGSKLAKLRSIDPEYLYLVRIMPRENIFDFVAAEDLPALWYFIRQNCISRRNRIIPNLEKWIPGCGPRLIIRNGQAESPVPLYPDEDTSVLPLHCSRCTTISNCDFYPGINIYTQFGDLSPTQLLTLFCEFRSWPQYKDSSFLASFESNMLKMESSVDAVDTIAEDVVTPDDLIEEQIEKSSEAPPTDAETPSAKSPRKRKTMQKS